MRYLSNSPKLKPANSHNLFKWDEIFLYILSCTLFLNLKIHIIFSFPRLCYALTTSVLASITIRIHNFRKLPTFGTAEKFEAPKCYKSKFTRIEIPIEDSDPHTSSAGAGGCDILAPHVGMRVISLDAVQVARSVMTPHSVEQSVQYGYTHPTTPLAHTGGHSPLLGHGIVSLYRRYRISTAPTSH